MQHCCSTFFKQLLIVCMFLSAWYYSRVPGRDVQLARGVRICGWRTHRREAVTTCTTLHTAVQYSTGSDNQQPAEHKHVMVKMKTGRSKHARAWLATFFDAALLVPRRRCGGFGGQIKSCRCTDSSTVELHL